MQMFDVVIPKVKAVAPLTGGTNPPAIPGSHRGVSRNFASRRSEELMSTSGVSVLQTHWKGWIRMITGMGAAIAADFQGRHVICHRGITTIGLSRRIKTL